MKPASLSNLTRRGLLRSGGALVVSFTLPSFAQTGLDSEAGKPLDPKQVDSFLAVHAHPARSSPTRRGKALRELLLCQKVPAPPPNGASSTVP